MKRSVAIQKSQKKVGKIGDFVNKIILGDCLEVMKRMPSGKIDLVFADPPYNIGMKYDTHDDRMRYEDYVRWCGKWLKECCRLLSKKGSIYVAINDEHAAEMVMIMKKLGLHMRNWIIWHYTFGQSMKKKFSRSHTHVLYFTKSKQDFIFNSEAIRVKSVRQMIGDKRANPKGKIPDDVWTVSRVAGTFKERIRGFPCQMPVKVLDKIIKTSSSKSSIVFDPFSGTGTTVHVAKKLGRKYIGMEISPEYHKVSNERLTHLFDF